MYVLFLTFSERPVKEYTYLYDFHIAIYVFVDECKWCTMTKPAKRTFYFYRVKYNDFERHYKISKGKGKY